MLLVVCTSSSECVTLQYHEPADEVLVAAVEFSPSTRCAVGKAAVKTELI